MPKDKYMGRGYSGTKGRPQLQKDLARMSDSAKRKRLEQTTADNLKRVQTGKSARSVSQYEREKFQRRTQSVARQIRTYQAKVADLREKAARVERSGTGNQKAAATYRQAAEEYLQKIKKLRAKKGGK